VILYDFSVDILLFIDSLLSWAIRLVVTFATLNIRRNIPNKSETHKSNMCNLDRERNWKIKMSHNWHPKSERDSSLTVHPK